MSVDVSRPLPFWTYSEKHLRIFQNRAYRKDHEHLSSEEIQALREELALTQAELAEFLKLGPNTISRWETGRLAQSASMDVLLCLIRDIPQTLEYLKSHAEQLKMKTLS